MSMHPLGIHWYKVNSDQDFTCSGKNRPKGRRGLPVYLLLVFLVPQQRPYLRDPWKFRRTDAKTCMQNFIAPLSIGIGVPEWSVNQWVNEWGMGGISLFKVGIDNINVEISMVW